MILAGLPRFPNGHFIEKKEKEATSTINQLWLITLNF